MRTYDSKVSLPVGDPGRHLIRGCFLEFPGVHIPNGISIGSSVSARLMVVTKNTDRPNDNGISGPHLMLRIATQPNNNG